MKIQHAEETNFVDANDTIVTAGVVLLSERGYAYIVANTVGGKLQICKIDRDLGEATTFGTLFSGDVTISTISRELGVKFTQMYKKDATTLLLGQASGVRN